MRLTDKTEKQTITRQDRLAGNCDGQVYNYPMDTIVSYLQGEVTGGSSATEYLYGAHIANFLKKLREWTHGNYYAKCPTIVIIGDSHTNGVWVNNIATYLYTNFNFNIANLYRYNYGGHATDAMLPYIKDIVKMNPDLFIFCEWDGNQSVDTETGLQIVVDDTIKYIKESCSSDIMICTTGMHQAYLDSYMAGQPLKDNYQYRSINQLRDIARINGCELVDTNAVMIKLAEDGIDMNTIYADGVHLTGAGYDLIYYQEIIKHFGSFVSTKNSNTLYGNIGKEDRMYFAKAIRYGDDAVTFSNISNITYINNCLANSTANDTITIDCIGSMGFELIHKPTTGSMKIELSFDDGNTWVSPSTIRVDGLPLQYATPVNGNASTPAETPQMNVTNRPIKSITIKDNIIGNGTILSEKYSIQVTVDGSNKIATVLDPNNNTIGTFIVGQTELETSQFKFPLKVGGYNNYIDTNMVASTYHFWVKSNWVDTKDLSETTRAKVFGFKKCNYKIKLTLLSGSYNLYGLNIFK